MSSGPQIQWLGRRPYVETYALQDELVAAIRTGAAPETVLLVEHEPIYTIGRTRDQRSLGPDLDTLPHPLQVINRGGQATYHGPGQLVGYPLLDLDTPARKRDLHAHLRLLEDLVLALLAEYGITGERREGLTGAWVGGRKIASIGVGVRKWVSMHGFGLNVSADLGGYEAITPCGLPGVEMTSISREVGQEISVEAAADLAARVLPALL